ncbi:hypothetical protein CRENBAI_000517 [Crenichthys baileyi]|uniref:Uncharacterized protein n=1 Tax=Crenichthys baileyi TaxID=28760 RepID=A0AAV9S5U8_9TELE
MKKLTKNQGKQNSVGLGGGSAKTAGTFGEAVGICGGAAEEHAKRVRLRSPQGQEKEVETGSPTNSSGTRTRDGGISSPGPPERNREQEQRVGAVHPQTPMDKGTKCEGSSAWAPLEQNQEQDWVWEAVHPSPLGQARNRVGWEAVHP